MEARGAGPGMRPGTLPEGRLERVVTPGQLPLRRLMGRLRQRREARRMARLIARRLREPGRRIIRRRGMGSRGFHSAVRPAVDQALRPAVRPGSPSGTPSGFPAGGAAGSAGGYPAATYPAGYSAEYPQQPFSDPYAGPMPGATADPYGNVYTPAPGVYPEYSVGQVGFIPPMPPLPPLPFGKRRKEPIWAFVLIGMGLIFLLNTMGFVGHAIRFMWPMMMDRRRSVVDAESCRAG